MNSPPEKKKQHKLVSYYDNLVSEKTSTYEMDFSQLRFKDNGVYKGQTKCNLTIDRLMSSRLIEVFVRLIVLSLNREKACTYFIPRILQTFQTEDRINTLEAQMVTLR